MRRENGRATGARAESLAAAWLTSRGCRIIEANHRCRLGEIDLIAEDGGTVVFVEVKSKRGRRHGTPEAMVNRAKRRRIALLALAFLRRKGWLGRPARFDVVAVEWKERGSAEIRHHRSAFVAEAGW